MCAYMDAEDQNIARKAWEDAEYEEKLEPSGNGKFSEDVAIRRRM